MKDRPIGYEPKVLGPQTVSALRARGRPRSPPGARRRHHASPDEKHSRMAAQPSGYASNPSGMISTETGCPLKAKLSAALKAEFSASSRVGKEAGPLLPLVTSHSPR